MKVTPLHLTIFDLHRVVIPILYGDVLVPQQPPRTTIWEPLLVGGLMKATNHGPEHIRDLRFDYPRDNPGNLPDYVSKLVKRIPSDTLRSVKFLGSSETPEVPSDFLVHLMRNQRKLVEIDIRWPPEFNGHWDELASGFPIHALTTLTIGVKDGITEKSVITTAAFLSTAVNVSNVSIYGGQGASNGLERVLAVVQKYVTQLSKLQLRSFKIAEFARGLGLAIKTLVMLFDFSKLKSLTITRCDDSDSLFKKVSMQQPHHKYLAEVSIKRSHGNMDELSKILPHCTALESLELYDVMHMRRELDLAQVLPFFITGIHGKIFNIRKLFLHSIYWSMSAAYYTRGPDLIKRLLEGCPKLEELMLDFPPWIHGDRSSWNVQQSQFMSIIAHAPRLRLLINTTQDASRLNENQSILTQIDPKPPSWVSNLEQGYLAHPRTHQDAWMHNMVSEMFRTFAFTNPKLEVYGIMDPSRTRWFVRRPVLKATGKVETVVEEIWPKRMKFEKPEYDWSFGSNVI
ncbi:uncharacterized protein K452DRAFT_322806 [Aplosporella prunicola CBS 121167]|uniref:Uncharacterized protein n=1 Tax=Aplosporella prunicola CBS 121167 TaxID=1176127 RepID=A0A6A6AZG0_9PEZI|nr:uncharacterized protein K452DRAFT_322806 [Aplosporella prunicola CBS 121167]KAF2135861.1 hypothetical protein K452DRAFT_322806 [Aplosporella prunicola CBS 121167]